MAYSVAIDGPAGAGKSTIAKLISKEMGYIYVDTGAMYRAMAVYFTKNNIDPDDENAINAAVDNVDISIEYQNGEQQVILNGENVTGLLRTEETGNMASRTSKYKEVRSKLVELQRQLAKTSDVVMDGRDIGTTVLPDAFVKIYLTASSDARAKRRYDELTAKGEQCDINDIKEDIDPALYDWTRISCLTEKYADRLKGLKIKMGKSSVGNLGIKPLKKAIQIAEMCGLPLVVHVTDPGVSIEAIAECLRPGDIFCHMYQGKGETILDKEGSIRKSIQDARERGVLFDACNGNGNFSISVAQKALKQKFFPDIISTDLTPNSWYQGYAVSMPELMSKYLALGLLLEQIIRCTTWNPAKFLGKERELGTLQAGTAGDVTVWKLEQQNRRYFDCTGDSVDGNAAVYPVMTIKSGMICWRAPGF